MRRHNIWIVDNALNVEVYHDCALSEEATTEAVLTNSIKDGKILLPDGEWCTPFLRLRTPVKSQYVLRSGFVFNNGTNISFGDLSVIRKILLQATDEQIAALRQTLEPRAETLNYGEI